MKKHLLPLIALTLVLGSVSVSRGQTALFIYNDGNGAPNAGTYHPGDSFTFSINLQMTTGGSIQNLDGVSYWFTQQSPGGGPFPFSITLRDPSGSAFTDLQTPGLTYPQNINPTNANDLGGALPQNQAALTSGTYFVANITVTIPTTAPVTGTFVISNSISGGKTSVISDSFGHTFAIPEADYTITMIPEPATWLTPTLGVIALLVAQRRRVLALCRAS